MPRPHHWGSAPNGYVAETDASIAANNRSVALPQLVKRNIECVAAHGPEANRF